MKMKKILVVFLTFWVCTIPAYLVADDIQHIDKNIVSGSSIDLVGRSDDLNAILLSNVVSGPDIEPYTVFYLYNRSWGFTKTIDEVLANVASDFERNDTVLQVSPDGEYLLFAVRTVTSSFHLYSYNISQDKLAEISPSVGFKSVNYVLGFIENHRVLFANYNTSDTAAEIYSNSLNGNDIKFHTSIAVRFPNGDYGAPDLYGGFFSFVSKDGFILYFVNDDGAIKFDLTVDPSIAYTLFSPYEYWGAPTISDDGNIFTLITFQNLLGEASSVRHGYVYISNEDQFFSPTDGSFTKYIVVSKDGSKILYSSTGDHSESNWDKNLELFVSGPQGANIVQITDTTNPKTTYLSHVISADGNTIAYVQIDDNDIFSRRNFKINVYSALTKTTRNIETLQNRFNGPILALSNDGSKLLYQDYDENDKRRLLLLNLKTLDSNLDNDPGNNAGSGSLGFIYVLLLILIAAGRRHKMSGRNLQIE